MRTLCCFAFFGARASCLPLAVCGAIAATLICSIDARAQGYQPRNYYGALFEEPGILHGAGQTYYRGGSQSTSFNRYADVLGPDAYPLLYMDYNNWTVPTSWYDGLKARLDGIQADDNRFTIPQLGMVLPQGNTLLNQSQINTLVDGLSRLKRPVYFRPGYEANGPWNALGANTFKLNFQSISNAVHAAELPVAMVWNVVVGDGGNYSTHNNAMNFYPGDDYVDWWSFNNFGSVTFNNPFWDGQVDTFLAAADSVGKPVMIGEATPQFIGADDPLDWGNWFAKYFQRIKDNPGIKAYTYINWDWATTNAADGWTNWGDARLETGDAALVSNYIAELNDSIYVHAGMANPFAPTVMGDYSGDGFVSQADLDLVLLNWGDTVLPAGFDPDAVSGGNSFDNLMSQNELDGVLLNWGNGAPSDAAIPEPTTMLTYAAVLGALSTRSPRRSTAI